MLIKSPTVVSANTNTSASVMPLMGVDFTSTPSRRKAITVAHGYLLTDGAILLDRFDAISDWPTFEKLLLSKGPWVGAFDFPFSLPRELIEHLGWPLDWAALVMHCAELTRSELRLTFKAFCDARPTGRKFAHRAADIPAGSSSSMKWVNPPVAYMFHEGARRLLQANITLPAMFEGRSDVFALEAYPGLLARSITKASYKSDDKAKQTIEREGARQQIVGAILSGTHHLNNRLIATETQCDLMIKEPSADWLDASLCLLQAGWAANKANCGYGLPHGFDALEGWIIGA